MSELRVTAAHVRELSARQGEAQAQIQTASSAADGTGSSMWSTHGIVCAAANAAVTAAEEARRAAGAALQAVSADLSQKLDTAATRYDEMDSALGKGLDQQMPPR
jgi:ESX secretion-associated protein EspC/F